MSEPTVPVPAEEYLRLCAQHDLVRLAHQVVEMSGTEFAELNAVLSVAHARPWYHPLGSEGWQAACDTYTAMSTEGFTETFEAVSDLFTLLPLTSPFGRVQVVEALARVADVVTSVAPELADGLL